IRGVVLQPLRRYGDKFAIVMSAAIFSILHGNMVQIPYTLVAGIYFGYLCVATGSLWPSIVLHFINNMFSVIQLVVLSNYGEEKSAIAVMLMLGVLIAIGIAGGFIFFNMNYKANLKSGVDTLKTGEKTVSVLKSPAMIIAIVFMLISTALSVKF
ncbi:MAG: CPBP family intramembrane metalloprotease, partial [Oscillospiraceae bacterium]|nr:CPBP family intramembrane metalloprotease [Oscillospiraceae bacterium]